MRSKRSLMVGAFVCLSLTATSAVSCTSDSTTSTVTSKPPLGAAPTPPKASAAPVDSAIIGVDPTTEARCDPMATQCLLPWPNDHFTVADPSTPTSRRLALDPASMPANVSGVHVDTTDQNRADGWSPGSALMVQFDGLDVAASKLPTLADPSTSLAESSPIVLLDSVSAKRLPFWAELDANADAGDVAVLLIHPAVNFADGHRIVVGLRNLVDSSGAKIDPSPAFAAYRDGQRTTDTVFEARRPSMDQTFEDLRGVGVKRADLQLAWEFTVASTESLTGRMVAMRDDAFAALGDAAPTFTVDTVTEHPDPLVRRRVEGTFETPLYLTDGGAPGGRLVLDEHGVPTRQDGTFTAGYICDLPAKSETTPARMSLYGHGLLGDMGEVKGDLTKKMSDTYDIAYCATDWFGLAEGDVGNALVALQDLSKFPSVADRLQQGMLAFLYLGRLMKHADGFTSNDAFRFGGKPALQTDELYFDGNSQGSIVGGALTAVAQDFTRSALSEAGMNYGLLLDRSVDFDDYLTGVLKPAYPKRTDRMIALAATQLLWDRGDADGYANHMTGDPLPKTPKHVVLLQGAVGDHQVSEFSLRVEAATIGAAAHVPIAGDGRVLQDDPAWLLKPITSYPHSGSAYVLWDTGSPSSPLDNVPPRDGHDPHDDTPSIGGSQALKDQFWHPDGAIEDVCGGDACTASIPPENAD